MIMIKKLCNKDGPFFKITDVFINTQKRGEMRDEILVYYTDIVFKCSSVKEICE